MLTLNPLTAVGQLDTAISSKAEVDDYLFLDPGYLGALEASGAVSRSTGWQPHHLEWRDDQGNLGWLPAYQKFHSRGEYVFDWSWAQAAESLGLAYYPKLLCAIPFTPCPGPRWQGRLSLEAVCAALEEEARRLHLSSWHLLFVDNEAESPALREGDWLERHGCHFLWHNPGYRDFQDFLDQLRSSKRKNLRKERRRLADQGIWCRRRQGEEISPAAMDAFFRYYCLTYAVRGQRPYLNRDFFHRLHRDLGHQLLLVEAWQEEHQCAAALLLHDTERLYGRWWGTETTIDGLHFETCYYQGMEFAIERGLAVFDPGTQGEHKLIRGFEPCLTRSFHQVFHPGLAEALQDWTARERAWVSAYRREAEGALPYRARTTP